MGQTNIVYFYSLFAIYNEYTRIVNRIKATLERLNGRDFNTKLKKVTAQLENIRSQEGTPSLSNVLAEF